MNENALKRNIKTQWYQKSRFGLFLHWGLYSVPGVDEWLQSKKEIPKEKYEKYIDHFTAENFHPEEWAKEAKNAGMKYAILTAKHHEGFCLFDTKYTDFNSLNAPSKRDLVKEFVEAFRKEGIKVGLYYSLIDWHHPDYPAYGDRQHPMRNNIDFKDKPINFQNYLDYMHGQIKELLTNYGKIDIMWFDFSYNDMKGEVWQPEKIVSMINQYQPDMIIDDRMEGSGSERGTILTPNPSAYAGDFVSPEQIIPPEIIKDTDGNWLPWESCITMNQHWCYSPYDKHYKSARLLIRTLIEYVSKNGNLLIDIGPGPRGEFSPESVTTLREIGEWMRKNDESVYGCGPSSLEKPDWGRFTQKDNVIYAHVFEENISAIPLKGLSGKIDYMELLEDGTEIIPADFWTLKEYGEFTFIFFNQALTDCYPLPDERDTVVKIVLKK